MIRFASLGSGSKGNALLVESRDCRVVVDCGFTLKELEQRLSDHGVDPQTLDALVVTHEHGDHSKGIAPLVRRYGLPVWMTYGTSRSCKGNYDRRLFHAADGGFSLKDLEITPYTVPHDSREPCQYLFTSGGVTLGVLTDTGMLTPHINEILSIADALVLECNHDETMLAQGPYPPRLKARVGGIHGHLSNRQAAELLKHLDCSRLQHLAAAHLSEKNNHPDKAKTALLDAAPEIEDRLSLFEQDSASRWMEVVA